MVVPLAAGHRYRCGRRSSRSRTSESGERFESIKLVYSVREKELAYRELIAGLAEREYLAEICPKLQFSSGGDPRAGTRLPERISPR